MTLAELFDAIGGFNKHEQEKREWYLWGVRKQIAFAAWIGGNKDLREEDIYSLELDEEMRKQRYANMTPIKVTTDGTGQ